VDGVGAGATGGVEQGLDVEVVLGGGGAAESDRLVGELDMGGVAVGIAVDGDGCHPQRLGGAHNPAGDLAAVCHEQLAD
jgi:hypothetical protein